MSVAELLRQERERRGLTLQQLAEETRIPLDRLAALEHVGSPPDSGFYQRARVRAYAHALNLDECVVLEQLDQELAAAAPPPVPDEPAPRGRGFPLLPVAVSIGCLIAVAAIGSLLLNSEPDGARVADAVTFPASSDGPGLSDDAPPVQRVRDARRAIDSMPASLGTAGTVATDATSNVPILPAVMNAAMPTQLVITSVPAGARVTVDGIGWGATPVTIRHLTEGAKRIRVTSDGYAAVERVVQVQPERANNVSIELRATELQ